MSTDQRKRFTVISNTDYEEKNNSSGLVSKPDDYEKNRRIKTNGQDAYSSGQREKDTSEKLSYHTNPMYEKLLQFQQEQKRKRFTVDDLLKW